MQIFIFIYIFLYITYVILGPHYISRIIKNDTLQIATSLQEIISRMFYFTYIVILFNAYFFYNPTLTIWIIATIVNILSIIGFIVKFNYKRDTDPYYKIGIISHIILSLPIFIGFFYYNLNKEYSSKQFIKLFRSLNNFTYSLILLTIFIIIYFLLQNRIYEK